MTPPRSGFAQTLRTCGFTLIELMATIVIMGIFAQMVGSFSGWQLAQYAQRSKRLMLDDSARSVINMLRDDVHRAGFGFALDPEASGYRYAGECDSNTGYGTTYISQEPCTGVDEDGLSDRVSFAYGDPLPGYVSASNRPSRGPCPSGSTRSPDNMQLMLSPNDYLTQYTDRPPSNGCHLIAGPCESGSTVPAATGVICTDSLRGSNYATANEDGCAWVLKVYPANNKALYEGCTNGWAAGFSYSAYRGASYYMVKNSAVNSYELYKRDFPQFRIAKNITKFQVTYGLDLSTPMDGKLDDCPSCTDDPDPGRWGTNLSWCRDLNSLCGLSLTNGTPLNKTNIYNRIIALHVSFRLYTDTAADGVDYRASFSYKNRVSP